MKILISGGHLTPALAFLEYAQAQHDEIIFAGRLYTQRGKAQESREQAEVEARGVKFISFHSGKLTMDKPWLLPWEFIQVKLGFWRAFFLLLRERPHVFVSFGGYLAVPLAVAAWGLRIPVVTHEQTRSSGIANKLIAHFANAVAVAYEDTLGLFPANKTVFVGNPIRHQLLNKKMPQPSWYHSKSLKPLLYITGGSQGSQMINTTVWQALPKLMQDWVVVHQCGNPTSHMNYKLELEQRAKQLPLAHQANYMVQEWLSEDEQAWVYAHAEVVATRAGANTVQEVVLLGKPAIFIPLPFAHEDEQTKNAQAVAETGAAILIPQKSLNDQTLLSALDEMQLHHSRFVRLAKKNQKQLDAHADQRLYELVARSCGKPAEHEQKPVALEQKGGAA